ncbi:hypothetical protein GCT13_14680 [Paraburkholderia sp. CNPSo 3157]|uniref:DUF5666 domain-containing protein n=1 Tax=Paraburkholderia franconis TaxID=2654983 RepID=A0A7X1NAS8_9BURK|nr:hypothetical protein [Paraburkholderia franconis]MPW18136.1 hypothetical protein [Paraburkholderia franconis]
MKVKNLVCMTVAALTTTVALAQPQTSLDVTKGPEKTTAAGTTTVTATIVAIEPATRTVTLKDGAGKVIRLEVGDETRNFDQLKVGDVVTTVYTKAISVSLAKKGGPRSGTQRLIQERAASGEKPGGTVGREVTVMADVVSVSPKLKTITVKGPQGSDVDLIVENPEQLKNIRKGDHVEVVYTESVAISVTPASTK